jgi:hypothetical protein
MTSYLRRVLSRMSAAAAPGTLKPAAERSWTSAAEPFGIGPPLSEPFGIGPALSEPPASLVTPATPATGGDRPAASPPPLPSEPPQTSSRAKPGERIKPVPDEPAPAPSRSPRPRYRRRSWAEPDDRMRADPVTVPHQPTPAGYQRPTPVPHAADRNHPPVTEAASPVPQRSSEPQFSVRLPVPAHRSTSLDERPAPAAPAEMREPARPATERAMIVAPATHTSPAPAPQPDIVIGRISVIVDSPRPVPPTAPQRAQRRRASAAPTRTTALRFAHRFGIGQL